jgi:serine/threonine-protein kinase RsbW
MAALRASAPPAAAMPVQRWVLDDYTQLTLMRSSLQQTLDVHVPQPSREREEIVESMALVATELATNALSHAGSPTVVQLLRAKTSFILDVADDEPTKAPEVATGRLPGRGGLGLNLTRRLAHDGGWYSIAHPLLAFDSKAPHLIMMPACTYTRQMTLLKCHRRRRVLPHARRRPHRRRRGLQRQAARVGGLRQLPSAPWRPRGPNPYDAIDDHGEIRLAGVTAATAAATGVNSALRRRRAGRADRHLRPLAQQPSGADPDRGVGAASRPALGCLAPARAAD